MAITGYNANPPPNDGSQVEANEIVYDETAGDGRGIKRNLADPIKNEVDAIETTGLPITPPTDQDVDLITLNVTGTPKFSWDESEDEFTLNKGLNISGLVTFVDATATTARTTTDMVTLTGDTLTTGNLLKATNTISGSSLAARSAGNNLIDIDISRTETRTSGTTADDYDLVSLTRTSVTTGAGGTLTAAGSVAKFENIVTQTAGTLTDTVDVLELVQDADSAGGFLKGTGVMFIAEQAAAVADQAGFMQFLIKNTDPTTAFVRDDAGIEYRLGNLVQVVNTQTGAVATTTTVMPDDDTIPQNDEGGEFMTLAITPTNTNNKLKIEITCVLGNSTAARFVAALFQDTTTNALAGVVDRADSGGNIDTTLTFAHFMTAGTTSATTFKVRAGIDVTGTCTFNGISGNRRLGGVMASSITITEILA